jgi:purine-nucleoside phosphorylase
MSTVPEVIAARQLGLVVVGLSCITNAAAGLAKSPISHGEVLEQSRQVSNPATSLLMRFCELTCKP